MQNFTSPFSNYYRLRLFVMPIVAMNIVACDAPQKVVKIWSNRVQVQASQLCTITPPSLLETITEKTELISSW